MVKIAFIGKLEGSNIAVQQNDQILSPWEIPPPIPNLEGSPEKTKMTYRPVIWDLLGTVHKHLLGGTDAKWGALNFLPLGRGALKKYNFSSKICIYMLFYGIDP